MDLLKISSGMRIVWPNPVATMELRRMRIVAAGRVNWYLAGCALAAICWSLAVFWAMALESRSFGSAALVRVADLYRWHQLLVLGVVSYGVGFFAANGLVREGIAGGELSELYFTRLLPPEIVQGKALAAGLPWVVVVVITSLVSTFGLLIFPPADAAENLYTTWIQGGILSALLRSVDPGPVWQMLFTLCWLPISCALGCFATMGGVLGGIRFGIRGRGRLAFQELNTQLGIAALAGLAGFQAIGFCGVTLGQVDGYDVLSREFWWHATFIPEERMKK